MIEEVYADLREAKIKAKVTGRPKHLYSVYQKMIARNVGFDEIYDLVGIRILVTPCATATRCSAGRVRVEPGSRPVQGLHRDAQVQHVPVAAHDGDRPGRQARRTADPHLGHAPPVEYGVAAHWKYKEEVVTGRSPSDLAWLRQLVDWQRETADPAEFLESLRFEVGSARGLRVHAARRGHRAAAGRDAGGLRLCDPHRGRPPHRRGQG